MITNQPAKPRRFIAPPTPALRAWLVEHLKGVDPKMPPENRGWAALVGEAMGADESSPEYLSGEKYLELSGVPTMTTPATPEKLFPNPAEKDTHKYGDRALGRYRTEKSVGRHAKLGTPVRNEFGVEVETASEFDHARAGAFLKRLARRSGMSVTWRDDEDGALLNECYQGEWTGNMNGEHHEKIAGNRVKALLDDVTSGGIEIVPIFFDDQLVTFPLLSAELFPLVDLQPIPRGRRVEGGSVATPTVSWGGVEGTEMSLFNTAGLVSALDTTCSVVQCAVEVGKDFLNDSPTNVGSLLTQLIGERFAAELDKKIAVGAGTTEPTGVMVASGTTGVSFGGVTATIGGYESLLFSVPKQYRVAGNNPVFCSNEVSYRRARAIPVSGTDARRIFGMTHEDFKLLERPHKISADMTNAQIFFGCMKKYRMYRVAGVSFEWHTQGDYLGRRNLALLIARARYGGQPVDGDAFGVVTDAAA